MQVVDQTKSDVQTYTVQVYIPAPQINNNESCIYMIPIEYTGIAGINVLSNNSLVLSKLDGGVIMYSPCMWINCCSMPESLPDLN